jgi:hypothetical protein
MNILIIFFFLVTISLLIILILKGNKIMTSLEKLQEQMTEVDAETTRIAELLQTYLTQLAEGTITIEQLQSTVGPELEKLKALGKPA